MYTISHKFTSEAVDWTLPDKGKRSIVLDLSYPSQGMKEYFLNNWDVQIEDRTSYCSTYMLINITQGHLHSQYNTISGSLNEISREYFGHHKFSKC